MFNNVYLKQEISLFWKMVGDEQYSVDSMDRAFQGLCQCYLHTKGIQPNDIISFEAAANNWQRVRLYRILRY